MLEIKSAVHSKLFTTRASERFYSERWGKFLFLRTSIVALEWEEGILKASVRSKQELEEM